MYGISSVQYVPGSHPSEVYPVTFEVMGLLQFRKDRVRADIAVHPLSAYYRTRNATQHPFQRAFPSPRQAALVEQPVERKRCKEPGVGDLIDLLA